MAVAQSCFTLFHRNSWQSWQNRRAVRRSGWLCRRGPGCQSIGILKGAVSWSRKLKAVKNRRSFSSTRTASFSSDESTINPERSRSNPVPLVKNSKVIMKRALIFLLTMYVVVTSADELKISQPGPGEVIHVATALDHLTVLEFGEPVTMAAAGSPAFQIERHEDRVFIKPLKAGASTDLFVWTASRRFAYELEPPGEVKNMNFAVDRKVPAPKVVPESKDQMNDIADRKSTRLNSSHI